MDLVWLEGQTWRDLQRAMRRGPWHIFHFIGHGGFDRATDEGLIALADDAGRAHLLRATDLGRLLDDHYPLRLVLLNSCEGARGGERDAFSGTAATLVRRDIPAVLAMQYEINDEAAVEFSRSFYEAVADGLPVDAADSEARTAVGICLGDTLEWGTPVLYLRSPDGRVFDVHQPTGAGRDDQTTTGKPQADPAAPGTAAPVGAQPSDEPTEHGPTRGAASERVLHGASEAPSAVEHVPAVRQESQSVRPVGVDPAAPRVSRRPSIPLLLALLVGGGLLLGVWLLFALRPDRSGGVLQAGQNATATARGQALVAPQTPRPTVLARTNPRNGAVSSDTAMFRGNLAHTGVYPEAGPAPQEGQLVWRFTADGEEIDRPPAISGNTAYFGSRGGYLYAVDLENRVARWTFEAGSPVRSCPAVAGQTVYMGSDDRNLYAVDTTTGKERWRLGTGGAVYAAPAVAEGIVYAGSDDGHLYAVDAHTGRVRWKHKTGGSVTSSPALDGGTVYVGSQDSRLYALDAKSGKRRWSLKTGGAISSSPAVQKDLVYVGSRDSRLYAVDRDTGRPKWDVKTGDDIFSSPAVSHGLVLFGSHDRHLHAVDAETGKRRWAFETRGYVGSSPSIVDDLVLFGSGDKNLYALDVVTGRLRWRYETEGAVGTSPAIAGGIVYFRGLDGYLYAVW